MKRQTSNRAPRKPRRTQTYDAGHMLERLLKDDAVPEHVSVSLAREFAELAAYYNVTVARPDIILLMFSFVCAAAQDRPGRVGAEGFQGEPIKVIRQMYREWIDPHLPYGLEEVGARVIDMREWQRRKEEAA